MASTELERAVSELTPRSAAAKLRGLMPTIEQQIARGVRRRDITAALNEAGMQISQANFDKILTRYRQKHGRVTAESDTPSARVPDGPEEEPVQPASTAGDDDFERSLDPVSRDQFADQFMARRRPIVGSAKNNSDD